MSINIYFELLKILISTLSFMGIFYIFLEIVPNLLNKFNKIKGVV
jgi:hypothetical protein